MTTSRLQSFKNRYNIGASVLSGEGTDVNPETIEDWKKRLPSIIEGYELKDVFNADETGLFFRGLPERSLVVKKGERKGGKKAKERITLLLCCSGTGEKFIIGKSANPRCFRGINVRTLNIRYESNRRAWMTRDIFVAWLKSLNNKFRRQNRKILLFVDNCSAHPDIQLSNIKLKFLPPNTTSKLQPCDVGIIQTLKANYRIQLVNHILWHINDCASASELAKSVTVLDAMKWVKKACMSPRTIEKCFINCGVKSTDENSSDDDSDVVEHLALQPGSDEVLREMSIHEFANIDEHLQTTPDEVSSADSSSFSESDDLSDDDEPEVHTSIPTHSMAYNYSQELYAYALFYDNPELMSLIDTMQSEMQKIQCCNKPKQSKLQEFFTFNRKQ